MKDILRVATFLALMAMVGCLPPGGGGPASAPGVLPPVSGEPTSTIIEPPPPEPPPPALTAVDWAEVDGWRSDNPAEALDGLLKGCQVMQRKERWEAPCTEARLLDRTDRDAVRAFFERSFTPHRVNNPDGSDTGLITGYYVPELKGSRSRSERYRYPLYAVPDDLLIVDLRSVYPDLANYRLRGRLVGRKVVPYYSRSEIENGRDPLAGKELCWVEDPVELFFMQIQGSGKIVLDDGATFMVHYADQNGHPFRSIGKLLLDRGEMTRDQMSMQNIKAWGRKNPDAIGALLNENPSYVFFETLAGNPASPPGALGVPLSPGRSIAVDPRSIPLGSPVFLSARWPGREEPLQRLMLAQDTGGAIRGAVRADFFWGLGNEAGELAGRTRQQGRMWVLLPQATAEEQLQSIIEQAALQPRDERAIETSAKQ